MSPTRCGRRRGIAAAAEPAAEVARPLATARFVAPPETFVSHTPERSFIGPGTIVPENGEILTAAPWGRPPTNFEQRAATFPVPPLSRSTDGGRTWATSGRMNVAWKLAGMVSDGGIGFVRLKVGRLTAVLHRHVQVRQGTLDATKLAAAVHAVDSQESPPGGVLRGDALLRLWE